ncbi:MAG: hypothetical protein NUV76_12285 [Candidatus Kuenenia sp.]|nr:hypothetical protein [Candidatus Kuenenia sp.]
MKISSLITELQTIKDAHGDINVIRCDDGEYTDVVFVEFNEFETYYNEMDKEWKREAPVVLVL